MLSTLFTSWNLQVELQEQLKTPTYFLSRNFCDTVFDTKFSTTCLMLLKLCHKNYDTNILLLGFGCHILTVIENIHKW